MVGPEWRSAGKYPHALIAAQSGRSYRRRPAVVFIIFSVGILLLIGKILGVFSNMSVALFDLDQAIIIPVFYVMSLIIYFASTKVSTKIMLHKEY